MSEHIEELKRALVDAERRAERAERALRDVLEMGGAGAHPFRALVAHALDVITIVDEGGRLTFVSPAVEELTGFRCGELVGTPLVDLVHDDDHEAVAGALSNAHRSGPSRLVRVSMRLRRREGAPLACEAVGRNLLHDPDVRGVVLTIHDREESPSLRAELRHADMRAELAMRATGHGLWEWDAASGRVFWSRMKEMLGYEDSELATTSDVLLRVIHPDDRERVLRSAGEHLATGAPFEVEARLRTKDGDWRWTRTVGQVQRNLRGEPTRIVGYTADVHERKVAELAVVESERLFRALFESMPTAVTLRDMSNWSLIDCNPAAIRLLGCSSRAHLENLVPSSLATEKQPDGRLSRDVWAEVVRDAVANGTCRSEVWTTRANGETFLAEVRICVIERGGRRALLALTDDVTDRRMAEASLRDRARRTALVSGISQRFVSNDTAGAVDAAHADLKGWIERRSGPPDPADDEFVRSIEDLIAVGRARAGAEAELRASEERYRSLIERSRDAVFTIDLERRVRFASPAAFDIFGFTPEEFVSDPAVNAWVMQRAKATEDAVSERVRANGHEAPAGTTEWECVHKDGRTVFTECVLSTIRDAGGAVIGFQALSRDITERRAAQVALARAKEDAILASHAKSAFLASMSHELRTPLNGVIGMVDLLAKTRLDQRQQRYTEVARASAKLLLSVIDDVLDFSKIEAGKIDLASQELHVADLVEETVAVVALYAEEKGLKLSHSTSPELGAPLVGDPARVRQLLVNLIGNAVKFTSRGEVAVDADVIDDTDGHARVRVEVRDTGVGISEADRTKLFQPFSQVDGLTARDHGGTGLGLAISRELVERMGGRIGVESEPGVGSTFWFEIELPWAARAPKSAHGDERDERGELAGIRALVVDEDAEERAAIVRHLVARGMVADEAHDADAAFALLTERRAGVEDAAGGRVGATPHRLLIDARRAALEGRPSLAERVRAEPRTSDVAIVVIGTLAYAADAEQHVPAGVGYATKPVGSSQLLRVVRRTLRAAERIDDADGASAPRRGRRRILVVEDNEINAEVAGEILRSGGYDLDLAADGIEAVAAVKRRRYDLVLMDCQLPQMDGFEAATQIRALEASGGLAGARVPIVALTASATTGDLARCSAAGMDGHVAKPVDGHHLLRVVAIHLGGTSSGAPATAPSVPIADLDAARARVLGNVDLLRRIARKFAGEADLGRDAIRRAHGAGDRAALAFAAHRLRGQAAAFEAAPLVTALDALEDEARSATGTTLDDEIALVEAELERLLAFLRTNLLGTAPS